MAGESVDSAEGRRNDEARRKERKKESCNNGSAPLQSCLACKRKSDLLEKWRFPSIFHVIMCSSGSLLRWWYCSDEGWGVGGIQETLPMHVEDLAIRSSNPQGAFFRLQRDWWRKPLIHEWSSDHVEPITDGKNLIPKWQVLLMLGIIYT